MGNSIISMVKLSFRGLMVLAFEIKYSSFFIVT